MPKSKIVPPLATFGLTVEHLAQAYEEYLRGKLLRDVGLFLSRYAVRTPTQREMKTLFEREGFKLFKQKELRGFKNAALKRQASIARMFGVPSWVLIDAILTKSCDKDIMNALDLYRSELPEPLANKLYSWFSTQGEKSHGSER